MCRRALLIALLLSVAACTRPTFLGLGYDVVGTPLKNATHLVLLLHGYGAPGDNLKDLATRLVQNCPEGTSFVVVEGPYSAGGGKAWFKTTQDVPAARQRLLDLVRTLTKKTKLPPAAVAIAGFSQGAQMAVDVALHVDKPLGAALAMSGSTIPGESWEGLAQKVSGTRFFVSHGTGDNVISLAQGQAVRDLLERSGQQVVYVEFNGQHRIAPEVVQALPGFLTVALAH